MFKLQSHNLEFKVINEAVARILAFDYQPYSMIDNNDFIKVLKEAKPRSKLSLRTMLSRGIIPLLCNVEKNGKIDLLIANCNDSILATGLITDKWTSCTLDEYISFTVSFIMEDFKLQSTA